MNLTKILQTKPMAEQTMPVIQIPQMTDRQQAKQKAWHKASCL